MSALEIELTKETIQFAETLSKSIEEDKIPFENSNVLLLKLGTVDKTEGGLHMVTSMQDSEGYKAGLGIVLAVPRLLDESRDAKIAVGDLAFFTHESHYTIYKGALQLLFANPLKGIDPKIVCVSDADLFCTVPRETLRRRFQLDDQSAA